jgi:hypothetical protein
MYKYFGCRGAVAGAAMLLGAAGMQTSAFAGSDNSSDTWAGDVNGIALPTGTFLAIDYMGYRHDDEYVTGGGNNIFAKLTGGKQNIPSTAEFYTDITRFVYFSQLWGHPLVFEAAVPYVDAKEVNIGNLPAPVGGLGPQTIHNPGFIDPVLFVSYGLIVEPRNERFLALTNYFYLPMIGTYNKFAQVNTLTANQTTWVPQLAYAEGLGKFAPGLKSFWIDVIANASIHSDGDAPLALAPGVQFDKLTQDNSYDIKAFLRYEFMQAGHVAIGIEKSWGGNQIASGGVLQTIFGGPTSFGKDDFLKGHVQFVVPLMPDLHVGADITHDFAREGGLREDITAEVRVTKFFLPAQESLK